MKKLVTKSIGVMFILLTLFYTFIGCVNNGDRTDGGENEQNESNMPQGNSGPEHWGQFRFDNEQDSYYINDVTITIHYGGLGYDTEEKVQYSRKQAADYPCFDIYFLDSSFNKYFVRRVDENFISVKYSWTPIFDEEMNLIDRAFNHSEIITIPKEAFIEESGHIYFSVYGTNINERNPEYKEIFFGVIFYKCIDGNMVVLSDKKF